MSDAINAKLLPIVYLDYPSSDVTSRTIKGEHLGKASTVASVAPVTEKTPTKKRQGPLSGQGDSDLDDEIPDRLE